MKKDYKKSGKTNIKRLSGIVLSIVLVGGLIAGCGNRTGVNGNPDTVAQAEITTAAAETQTAKADAGNVSVKNNTETTAAKVEKGTTAPAVIEPITAAKESVTEAPKKPNTINKTDTPANQEATTTAAADNTPEDTPNVPEKPQHPKPVEKPTERPTEKQTEAATEKPTETPKPTEAPTQVPVHVHTWAERVIGERIVVDKPAWDETVILVPAYDDTVQEIVDSHLVCNWCGGEWPCENEEHGNSHTEYIYETKIIHHDAVTETIHHDAETHKENITETYCTGCGDVK